MFRWLLSWKIATEEEKALLDAWKNIGRCEPC